MGITVVVCACSRLPGHEKQVEVEDEKEEEEEEVEEVEVENCSLLTVTE